MKRMRISWIMITCVLVVSVLVWYLPGRLHVSPNSQIRVDAEPDSASGQSTPQVADMLEDEAVFVLEQDLKSIDESITIDQYEARRMTFGEYQELMSSDGMPLVGYPVVGDPIFNRDAMVWVIVFRTAFPLHATLWIPGPDEMIEYYEGEGGSQYIDNSGLVTASVVMYDYNGEILQQIVHSSNADVDLFAKMLEIPKVEYTHY